MGERLFRKKALESEFSSQQIDRLLRVAGVKEWIVLLFSIGLVILIGIWAFVGQIPLDIEGRALMFSPHHIVNIESASRGIVEEIRVESGVAVEKGQLLAILANPEKEFEYEDKKEIASSLEKEISSYKASSQEETKIRLQSKRAILESQKEKLKELMVSIKKEEKENDNFLYQLKIELFNTLVSIQTQEEELALLENQFANLFYTTQINALSAEWFRTQKEVEELGRELKNLQVFAPSEGTVIEVSALRGQQVSLGSPLLWLQTPVALGKDQVIYALVPIAVGERVKPGMPAKVELASVDAQKYGLLLGRVKEVLPYVASEEGERLNAIPSVQLRRFLLADSPSVLVVIEPFPDPSKPSGYRWTSPNGPPFPIAPGTLGKTYITIESRKPAAYVFPSLRS